MKKNIVNEAIKDANTLLGDEIAGLAFLAELHKKKKKDLVLLCEKYLIAIYGIGGHYKAKQDIDKIGDARWSDIEQALVAFAKLASSLGRIPSEKEWLSEISDTKYKWAFKRINKKELDQLPSGLGHSRARDWYRKFKPLFKKRLSFLN
ncbi:hypothetical protein [Polynucleobacter asymbioticus]|uniref:hypothetical protein n=1 Tax=Polynucleobacter asymbioticus TaxID=576611 RepID=UPI0008F86FF2|nr:hypothetical protein [Polynucleobacter asymbioticus]